MVTEFKLTIVHVERPNPMQIRGFTAGQKIVENQDWAVGRGPPDLRGPWAMGRGPWAAGLAAFSKTL